MKRFFLILPLLLAAAASLRAADATLTRPPLSIVAEDGLKELIKNDVADALKDSDTAWNLRAAAPDRVILSLSAKNEPGSVPLLRKGIVVAVAKKNPYASLDLRDVEKIFKNNLSFWPETDIPIRNVYYIPHVFESNPPKGSAKTKFNAVRFSDLAEKLMEHDPRAILLLPLSHAMAPPKTLKLIAINGISPDFDNIVGGKYPLQKIYYLKKSDNAPKEVELLLKTLLSNEYQLKIINFGTIPIIKGDAMK